MTLKPETNLLIALIEWIHLSVSLALKKTEMILFKVITLLHRHDHTSGNETSLARAQCGPKM